MATLGEDMVALVVVVTGGSLVGAVEAAAVEVDATFWSVTGGDGTEGLLLSPVAFVSEKFACCFLVGKHIQRTAFIRLCDRLYSRLEPLNVVVCSH